MGSLERVLDVEWGMFTAVNAGAEKASCQEDENTFRAMRTAQFAAWPLDALQSYEEDLNRAARDGRNLIREKYIHMMRTTAPGAYSALAVSIPVPSAEAAALTEQISALLIEETRELFGRYPYISGSARPLLSQADTAEQTSVETYNKGELFTYSEKTLSLLFAFIAKIHPTPQPYAYRVLHNTVASYGYNSLEEAERAALEEAFGRGVASELKFGCPQCDDDSCSLNAERKPQDG